MGLRSDFQQIGDLVQLCATTMRMLSVQKRPQGEECPFKPVTFQLEAISREIKTIAADLPAGWDAEPDLTVN